MPLIIYLVAFLEGFTTLSVEIVALRQFTPIIGTNSVSTSIILGVILLALSYGYYRGGSLVSKGGNISRRLVVNLLYSSLYYFFISFVFYGVVLQVFLGVLHNYFFAILFSTLVLFFVPVFLASQTIPLLAALLKTGKSGEENLGKLLFYSTMGSFVGSVGTSTILFPTIGVSATAIVSPILLCLCAFLVSFYILSDKKLCIISGIIMGFFVTFSIGVKTQIPGTLFYQANAYHSVHVFESTEHNKRLFLLNDAYSSGIAIDTKESFFAYIQETLQKFEQEKPQKVLVIGAAGFTFPREISAYDFVEQIDVVDVDGSLKDIAETYFLQESLSEKVRFFPEPSRYFLNTTSEHYDFVFVDVYTGKSLPPQVLTQEFFQKLSGVGDKIYLNLILDTTLESDFSRNLLTTIDTVFENTYYKNVHTGTAQIVNFIVSNTSYEDYQQNTIDQGTIYTDNKHSIEIDKFLLQDSF